MAHLIETVNGKAEIAFAGQTPWHGLGQNLTPDAPIEVWQQEAGLNWEANLARVEFQANGNHAVMPGQNVIYRSDTNMPLGVVTDRYCVHQPSDILDFFNILVESAGFKLEVAGAIKGGKRIWALANVNQEACVFGNDEMKGYLLLSTSFDGSTATIGQYTSIRVVCNNTLSAADNESSSSRIAITHGSRFDASMMRARLGLVVGGFEGMMDKYRWMARTDVTAKFADQFLQKLFPPTVTNHADGTPFLHSRGYLKVMDLFEGKGQGSNLPGVFGTRWGLLNAVTEFVDHHRGHNADTRLNNAWFGQGARLKSEAESLLSV